MISSSDSSWEPLLAERWKNSMQGSQRKLRGRRVQVGEGWAVGPGPIACVLRLQSKVESLRLFDAMDGYNPKWRGKVKRVGN